MNTVEEKFKRLCNGTANNRPSLFEKEREIVLQFHQELHAIYFPNTTYQSNGQYVKGQTATWKMMANVMGMDYRTLLDFSRNKLHPQKKTMKKINTLVELINERNY